MEVYPEMILQITINYPGLPDVRALEASEISFFYEGLRKTLEKNTESK